MTLQLLQQAKHDLVTAPSSSLDLLTTPRHNERVVEQHAIGRERSGAYSSEHSSQRWDWRQRAPSRDNQDTSSKGSAIGLRLSKRIYRRRAASASLKRGGMSMLERRKESEHLDEVGRRHGAEIRKATLSRMAAVRETAKRQRHAFIDGQLKPYVGKWSRLVGKETQEERNEVEMRRQTSLDELQRQGLVLVDVEGHWPTRRDGKTRVKQYGQRIGQFHANGRSKLAWNKFQKGDQVELRPGQTTNIEIASLLPDGSRDALGWQGSDECDQRFIPATIRAISDSDMRLSFEGHYQEADLLACPSWRIDLGYNDLVEKRVMEALDALSHDFEAIERADNLAKDGPSQLELSGSSLVPDIIRDQPRAGARQRGLFDNDQLIHSWLKRHLRPSPIMIDGDPPLYGLSVTQKRAVALMLSTPLSLVQGPPGTGKTTTIVAAIELLKAHFQVPHPILVTSHTNVAVDNLTAACLDAGLSVVRAGSSARTREGLDGITLESLMEKHPLKGHLDELEGIKAGLTRAVAELEAGRESPASSPSSVQEKDVNAPIPGEEAATSSTVSHSAQDCNYWRDEVSLFADTEVYRHLRLDEEDVDTLPLTMADIPRLEKRLSSVRQATFLIRKRIETDVYHGADVVCCTALSVPTCKPIDFPFVFFDEGSMATEPISLVPLVKGSRQIAIIGDHKQLPPVVQNEDARQGGMAKSLFERLIERGDVPSIMLDCQHRMHPSLSAFASQMFYDAKLCDGETMVNIESLSSSYRAAPSGADQHYLAFVNHSFRESSEGKSIENLGEAMVCSRIIADLLARNPGLQAQDIGLVTPYRGQAQHFARALADPGSDLRMEMVRFTAQLARSGLVTSTTDADPSKVEVHTVDGFEGREKQAVVFSTTRSNPLGFVGFLADSRRLNVALTRAKRGLWVVGNFETLRNARLGEAGQRAVDKADVSAIRKYTAYLENLRCVVKAAEVERAVNSVVAR